MKNIVIIIVVVVVAVAVVGIVKAGISIIASSSIKTRELR